MADMKTHNMTCSIFAWFAISEKQKLQSYDSRKQKQKKNEGKQQPY